MKPIVVLIAVIVTCLCLPCVSAVWDADDNYTVSLLHMDGANGGTVFIDQVGNRTWTASGTVVTATNTSKFSPSSGYFNNVSGRVQTGVSTSFDMGNSDWTIDAWIYPTQPISGGGTYTGVFSTVSSVVTGYSITYDSDGGISVVGNASGSPAYDASTQAGAAPFNTWSHVAVVRNGTSLKIYINGNSAASSTITSAYKYNSYEHPPVIGAAYTDVSTVWNYGGFIDELRVTKGLARWTSNFTVPNTPYMLITNSSVQATPNGGNTTPLTVQFLNGTPSSAWTENRFNWSFGDGNYSTTKDPSYTYYSYGSYTVNETVSNNNMSITVQKNVLVYPNYIKTYYNTTGAGTFTVPYGVNKISVLAVGAGGGGANPYGGAGGGGAGGGGVVSSLDYNVVPGSTYSITVGSGGTPGYFGGTIPTRGENTSFYNGTAAITAYGGGAGGNSIMRDAINGSSGGGAYAADKYGRAIYGGTQGHDGYTTSQSGTPYDAGGGGGAGVAPTSRAGGNGLPITWVSPSTVYYGGGGGGGSYANTGQVSGGLGGGGYGTNNANAGDGTANTGGGGGGTGGPTGSHGGYGGSGTVIVGYTLPELSASFTTNFTEPSVYPPTRVIKFNDTSSGIVSSWDWKFNNVTGNNTPVTFATTQNPEHGFQIGNFSISLIVNNGTASNTSTQVSWVNITPFQGVPIPVFSGTPLTGVVPVNVSFTDASVNFPTSWKWNFTGEQDVDSTSQNPYHVYNEASSYSVNLTACNSNGCNSTIYTDYIVVSPMVASFSSNSTTASLIVNAQFTGSSTGTPNTWYWDFGDGNTSTSQNPFHKYEIIGSYDVAMKSTNTSSGSYDWENKTGYINVLNFTAPVASFTLNTPSSYVPMTVVFTDTSTEWPTSWYWEFGDGNTSVEQNPTFIYNIPGLYTVNLTATNDAGSNKTQFKYVQATAIPEQPVANFSWSNTVGIELPVTVQFTDESTQSPTSWYWSNFGDGSGQTSLLQNPTHVYTSTGAFPVTLSVTNVNGTSSSRTKYVQISTTTGGTTSTITTVGSSTIDTIHGAGSYAWTCPSGVYSVKYLLLGGGAGGSNGGTSTGWLPITIIPVGGNKGDSASGELYTTPGQTYQFVVGSGGSSQISSVNGVRGGYSSPGGWVDTVPASVAYTTTVGSVNGGLTSAFGYTANGGTGIVNGLVYNGPNGGYAGYTGGVPGAGIEGIVSNIAGTYINYGGSGGGYGYAGGIQGGGNGYSYLGNPSTAGSFYGAGGGAGDDINGVADIGSDGNDGVIILQYQVITVIVPPVANFTGTPLSGTAPLTVQFTDYSTNGPTSWQWFFGDGGTSTEKNPSHTYTADGVYTVSLTDYNDNTTASGNMVRVGYVTVATPTPTPTVTAIAQQNTWWTPHTVQMTIMDLNGQRLTNVQINATYNQSSMPEEWINLLYGISSNMETQITNKSLVMQGVSGSDGTATFTMLGSLKYDIYLTSTEYNLDNYHVSTYPTDYMLNIYVPVTVVYLPSQISANYTGLNASKAYIVQNNVSFWSMCIDYQDVSGSTTSVTNIWKFARNGTTLRTSTYSPGSGLVTECAVVPHAKGVEYWWWANATRGGS
jgi:PKD repeat protein